MSKYSYVYSDNLERACNTALSELEKNKLNNIIKDLDDNRLWKSSSKKKCVDALKSINSSEQISGSIEVLKKKLNNLKIAAQKINAIKSKEADKKIEEKKPEKIRDTSTIERLNQEIKKLEREVNNLLK